MTNNILKVLRRNYNKDAIITIVVGTMAILLLGACTTTTLAEDHIQTDSPATADVTVTEPATVEAYDEAANNTAQSEENVQEDEIEICEETEEETQTQIPDETEAPEDAAAYTMSDFIVIYQMPELPTGCEITALTMVLNYYGIEANKVEMATAYLPTLASKGTYYGQDGLLYGNDMNEYFIGDPTGIGIICGTGAIIKAANSFLEDNGIDMAAVDMTGTSAEELYQMVGEGTPVIVWVTIGMQNRIVVQGWYTESGEYVDWATSDHAAVLIGYTENTVILADPISGVVEYDRAQFEKVFTSRSNQCVMIQ